MWLRTFSFPTRCCILIHMGSLHLKHERKYLLATSKHVMKKKKSAYNFLQHGQLYQWQLVYWCFCCEGDIVWFSYPRWIYTHTRARTHTRTHARTHAHTHTHTHTHTHSHLAPVVSVCISSSPAQYTHVSLASFNSSRTEWAPR